MFSTTKLSTTANRFDLEGGIYFVARENGTWKIKKYKEIGDTSKNITKDNFDNSFPSTAENLDGLDSQYQTN